MNCRTPGELAVRNTRTSKPWPNGQSGRKPSWQQSDISKDRHQQKKSKGQPSYHETQRGHTDPQIMAIKITATPWNWTRLGDDQDSISRGKNSKGGYENNYVSNAHSLDT